MKAGSSLNSPGQATDEWDIAKSEPLFIKPDKKSKSGLYWIRTNDPRPVKAVL